MTQVQRPLPRRGYPLLTLDAVQRSGVYLITTLDGSQYVVELSRHAGGEAKIVRRHNDALLVDRGVIGSARAKSMVRVGYLLVFRYTDSSSPETTVISSTPVAEIWLADWQLIKQLLCPSCDINFDNYGKPCSKHRPFHLQPRR